MATSLPESRRQNLHPAAPAFRLPVGPIQNQHWIATVDALSELEEPLREDWTAAHQHLDRLQERKLHVDFDAIYDTLRGLQDQVRRASGEEPSRRVPSPPVETAADEQAVLSHTDDEQSPPAPRLDPAIRRALVSNAERAHPEIRDWWLSLNEAIEQISALTDNDEDITALFETSQQLRQAIWSAQRSGGAGGQPADGPLEQARHAVMEVGDAQTTLMLVSQVMMIGFLVLNALENALLHRLGDLSALAMEKSALPYGELKAAADEADRLGFEITESGRDLGPTMDQFREDWRRFSEELQAKGPT